MNQKVSRPTVCIEKGRFRHGREEYGAAPQIQGSPEHSLKILSPRSLRPALSNLKKISKSHGWGDDDLV